MKDEREREKRKGSTGEEEDREKRTKRSHEHFVCLTKSKCVKNVSPYFMIKSELL
jgi:hypothetical protein